MSDGTGGLRLETGVRLRRESSAEQVASHIRDWIIQGELRKGDRLRQDEIAETLGVSRIPVREAIIALDGEGWVQFETNRGAFVTGLSADDILDHYELRGYVFGLIARRVAEIATHDDIAILARLQREMADAQDVGAFVRANERMLGRLLAIAGSPRLRAALLTTPPILSGGDFFALVATGRQVQTDGMAALVAALGRHHDDEADCIMRDTLARQSAGVLAAFTAAGLVGAE